MTLEYVDVNGDMHMTHWNLDKSFCLEDWGRDRCKRNWSLPGVDHNSSEVEHMV